MSLKDSDKRRFKMISKFIRKLVLLQVFALVAVSANALGMYAKGSIGYQFYQAEFYDGYAEANCFEISPAFGLYPFDNRTLALEATLDFSIGGSSENDVDVDVFVFTPEVMALVNVPLDTLIPSLSSSDITKKLIPYFGLGFSMPIESTDASFGGYTLSDSAVKFRMNFCAGARYNINEKMAITADFNGGALTVWTWSMRAGFMYTFK